MLMVWIAISFSCILQLIINVQAGIQWEVAKTVSSYGQELVLYCAVGRCCSNQAGWSKNGRAIFLDVRVLSTSPDNKYDGSHNRSGFSLIIRNLTETDLNQNYSCSYGYNQSNFKILSVSDAFTDSVFSSKAVSDKEISTVNYNEDSGKKSEKETGLSSREMFYYGMLAAGFVLVLFLSILCHACINRKYRRAIPKQTETKTDTTEDIDENREITERNDITSLYETINENEMLPDSVIARKNNQQSQESTPTDLSEKHYFEIDDSYLDVVHANDFNQSNMPLHKKMASLTATDISVLHQPVKRINSIPDSSISSEETVGVALNRDDGYLHPYVALKTNEMEYLHSYSTPCLVPVDISTISTDLSGPEAVDDYYTDGFSAKKVITQV